MRNYITRCDAEKGILNGRMSLDETTGEVKTYINDNGITGNVHNINPNTTELNFTVQFGKDPRRHPVLAHPDGKDKWSGNGGQRSETVEVEPWTATATIPIGTEDEGQIAPKGDADI